MINVLLNNTVAGNRIGTNAVGTAALPNNTGIELQQFNSVTIGSLAVGGGNLISGNTGAGIDLSGIDALSTITVKNNLIGTDASGTAALGNSVGINFSAGFADVGPSNVISGNTSGIRVNIVGGPAGGGTISGNLIGTDASGTVGIPNTADGIIINSSGWGCGGNLIAFNGVDGIHVLSGTGNNLAGNRIFSNGNLGIELGINGIVPNDPLDTDVGPNNLQNFPVILSAVNATGVQTDIKAVLDSTPNMVFNVTFYSTPTPNASGYGDGETVLGGFGVTSDINGHVTLNTSLVPVTVGQYVTATATDSFGNTSSFSAAVRVTSDATAPSIQITNPTAAATFATNSTPLNLSGITSDNVGVTGVAWTNSTGGSGAATVSSGTWNASISLVAGPNTITVTASDAAGNTSSAQIQVTLDQTAPTIAITIPTTLPTYSSESTPLSVWGTASDDLALASVTWSNSAGGSGTALGTTLWAAAIPLTVGSNIITITATDTAGNTATATLTVDYSLPTTTVVNNTTKKSCGALGLEAVAILLLMRLRRPRRMKA